MKKLILLGLASLGLTLGCSANATPVKAEKEDRDATIIVQLRNKANADNVLRQISSEVTRNYEVKDRYSELFSGFVLDIPSKYVSTIRNLPSVRDINYDHMLVEPEANDGMVEKYEITLSDEGRTASANTMNKPDDTNDGEGTFIAILDNGFYIGYDSEGNKFNHEVFNALDGSVSTPVTQASIKEKVDAAASFHGHYNTDPEKTQETTYFNNKVPFYYDYGGDKSGAVTPDYDVYAEGQSHGTHVASIAAGNAGDTYKGIAPNAQLALMKVFITYMSGQEYVSGGAPETAVLNALEDCLVLGVDVINMSLGSNLDDFDENSIASRAISTLVENGTLASISNGNEGRAEWDNSPIGYYTTDKIETNIIGSYANVSESMSIASGHPTEKFYGEALTLDGNFIVYDDQVTNHRVRGDDGGIEEIVYTPERKLKDIFIDGSIDQIGFVYTGDANVGAASDYETYNVSGKIAVVNRGDITFREKVDNAATAGAVGLIIIDNSGATELNLSMSFSKDTDASFYTPPIPVGFVLKKYKTMFSGATDTNLHFLHNQNLPDPEAYTPSSFSSDGMKYDLSIKPEITTPGSDIMGAVLGGTDKYEAMSGTSMAAPNYTGALALALSEHLGDANYRDTINSRMMSTAEPLLDTNGEDPTYALVRKQGAGMVDLEAMLTSDVYLTGVDENGDPINKAKIELFNNDEIAEGNLNLNFIGVSECSNDVAYTATTVVLAPEVVDLDTSVYTDLNAGKVQTAHSTLVEVFNDDVVIEANGNTLVNINHDIDPEKLAALDADFPNGVVLEGYVMLTPKTLGHRHLSIPYLGFYGDYNNVSPVEPFQFEKNSSKLYDSDILNRFLRVNIGKDASEGYDLTKADYSSYLLSGYWENTSNISFSNIVRNNATIANLIDGNGRAANKVGLNPYTLEYDPTHLYVGSNQFSNTLVMQQYVMRSCMDNTIQIVKKSDSSVVASDHLYDPLYGTMYDSETHTTSYPLYKSSFDSNLWDGQYVAHRAVGFIQLVDSQGKALPSGEYELRFNYTLANGEAYNASYDITLVDALPNIVGVENVNVAGVDYYRVKYSDMLLTDVKVKGVTYTPVEGDGFVYIDVPASQATGPILIDSRDIVNGNEKYFAHLDDVNRVMVSHPVLLTNPAYNFSYTVNKVNDGDQTFTFSFVTGTGSAASISGTISYKMLIPAGLDAASLKVYGVNSGGSTKLLTVVRDGDFISFSTTFKKIKFTSNYDGGDDDPVTPVDPTPSDPTGEDGSSSSEAKKGCGGSIVTTSVLVSSLAISFALLLVLAKGKKKEE